MLIYIGAHGRISIVLFVVLCIYIILSILIPSLPSVGFRGVTSGGNNHSCRLWDSRAYCPLELEGWTLALQRTYSSGNISLHNILVSQPFCEYIFLSCNITWFSVQVVLDKNKPKIRTVVNKTDAIQNDYRTMQLEILAGHDSLVTTVIESGLRFQVDLATVYVLILVLYFFSGDISEYLPLWSHLRFSVLAYKKHHVHL